MMLTAAKAEPFSNTISGYVTPFLVVLFSAIITYYFARRINTRAEVEKLKREAEKAITDKLNEFGSALAVQAEAIRTILSEVGPMSERVEKVEGRTASLSEATALLAQELEIHKEWAKESLEWAKDSQQENRQTLADLERRKADKRHD